MAETTVQHSHVTIPPTEGFNPAKVESLWHDSEEATQRTAQIETARRKDKTLFSTILAGFGMLSLGLLLLPLLIVIDTNINVALPLVLMFLPIPVVLIIMGFSNANQAKLGYLQETQQTRITETIKDSYLEWANNRYGNTGLTENDLLAIFNGEVVNNNNKNVLIGKQAGSANLLLVTTEGQELETVVTATT